MAREARGAIPAPVSGGPAPEETSAFPQGSPSIDAGVRAAALLAAVEIGLGSLLHGLRIPFAGFALSLNQGFFLARLSFASRGDPDAKALPASVSTLVALLKSLSPAGKRLTPMLGISMQGVLFNAGTLLLGRNVAGALAGSWAAALWGFVQPVAVYYVVFGDRMVKVAENLAKDIARIVPLEPRHFVYAALGLVALKLLLATATVALARWAGPEAQARYERALLRAGRFRRARAAAAMDEADAQAARGETVVPWASAARGAVRDLAQPLYLVSLGVGLFFFAFVESSLVQATWLVARFLAAGFAVFFLVRVIPVERLLGRLEGGRLSGFARRAREVIALLKTA